MHHGGKPGERHMDVKRNSLAMPKVGDDGSHWWIQERWEQGALKHTSSFFKHAKPRHVILTQIVLR